MSALKFSDEFREQIVMEVVQKSPPVVEAARSYGLVEQTVRNWVSIWKKQHPDPRSEKSRVDQSTENKKLKVKLRELEMENEFLKKAAAFFAQESK